MRRWRKNSEFGPGRRVPLDREQRAVFRARLTMKAFRRVGALTITAVHIAGIMLGMQGRDGRLDPSIETLAARAGVDPSTVVRALARLRECGFVTWVRRLVRDGSRVEQTSNAYVLTVPGTPDLRFAQAAKSVVSLEVKRVAEVTLSDKAARENAARQLELLGRPELAARMRA
jgi:DNA-binding transcriptional regulator YhcF (GntR family)